MLCLCYYKRQTHVFLISNFWIDTIKFSTLGQVTQRSHNLVLNLPKMWYYSICSSCYHFCIARAVFCYHQNFSLMDRPKLINLYCNLIQKIFSVFPVFFTQIFSGARFFSNPLQGDGHLNFKHSNCLGGFITKFLEIFSIYTLSYIGVNSKIYLLQ